MSYKVAFNPYDTSTYPSEQDRIARNHKKYGFSGITDPTFTGVFSGGIKSSEYYKKKIHGDGKKIVNPAVAAVAATTAAAVAYQAVKFLAKTTVAVVASAGEKVVETAVTLVADPVGLPSQAISSVAKPVLGGLALAAAAGSYLYACYEITSVGWKKQDINDFATGIIYATAGAVFTALAYS